MRKRTCKEGDRVYIFEANIHPGTGEYTPQYRPAIVYADQFIGYPFLEVVDANGVRRTVPLDLISAFQESNTDFEDSKKPGPLDSG